MSDRRYIDTATGEAGEIQEEFHLEAAPVMWSTMRPRMRSESLRSSLDDWDGESRSKS